MKIIIDADGCPKGVLQECLYQGRKREIQVWTVANVHHQIESDYHITVDGASQEADMKVVNLTKKGDVVITQDWGLAALVLGRGAKCIHTSGREFSNETIGFLLEERELKAKHRRGGGRTKGPSKRSREDEEKFRCTLKRVLDELTP